MTRECRDCGREFDPSDPRHRAGYTNQCGDCAREVFEIRSTAAGTIEPGDLVRDAEGWDDEEQRKRNRKMSGSSLRPSVRRK